MKMNKPARLATLLLLCLAAPLFAADDDALIEAARDGDTDAVKSLLAAGANVNAQDDDGQTALMRAARWGHTDTVRALLDAGANANMQGNSGWTALIHAVQGGHEDAARLLINVDVNDSDAALVAAAADGNNARVRQLIEGGVSAGARKNGGFSALMCAAFFGNTDAALLLIDSGETLMCGMSPTPQP